jgi:hypothetical protein
MLAALLSAFVLLAVASDVLPVFENGAFAPETVETRIKDDTIYFAFPHGRCVRKFMVVASDEATVVVESIRGHDEAGYKWVEVGSGTVSKTERNVEMNEAPFCGTRFRMSIAGASFKVVSAEADTEETNTEKRVTSCMGLTGWPTKCNRAADGALCLAVGTCGCLEDADCYSSTVNPFCNPAKSVCEYCTESGSAVPFSTHYFCRDRIPSRYAADTDISPRPASIPPSETVPLFAEMCNGNTIDQTIGACERCDQASDANVNDAIIFPNFGSVPAATQEYLNGNFFCRTIRSASSPTPSRPVCISQQQFIDIGMGGSFSTFTLDMEIAWAGKGTGTTDSPAIKKKIVTRTLADWEGACGPCVLTNGATTVRAHSACFITVATTPICDANPQVGCRRCNVNDDCGSKEKETTCKTDETGGCTGGANCMTDGSCKTCTSDLDCIGDGGETPNQMRCDVASGRCADAILCDENDGEGGAFPCETATPNCNKNGACIRCLSNANCGTTDGGSNTDQQVCNTLTGKCEDCEVNADCVGTSGANCMKDGSCIDCTTSAAICTTATSGDGGRPAGGCSRTANGFCADDNDQTICNTQTRQCEDPCRGNSYCSDKRSAQPGISVNNGANCNSDGTCVNCQTPGGTDIPDSPNCGAKDGPPNLSVPTTGVAGQRQCSGAGTCDDAFSCTQNSDCTDAPNPGSGCSNPGPSQCSNCQVGGSCQPCNVNHDTSTCGTTDGGETPGQINCEQSTRRCIGPCNSNNDCPGTQGANCMFNGLCLDCRSDADCQGNNRWNGDNNGETLCDLGTKRCFKACASNNDCSAPTPNCMKDGRCAACGGSLDCPGNDGPPNQSPSAINTVCRNDGLCVDPFRCDPSTTPGDNNGCRANGNGNNCMADLSCKTCTSNADCNNDGGARPNQPKCDIASGTCVECGSNNDCDGTGKILNCNDDGLCSACTLFGAGVSCQNHDGPPGTGHINPNCDPLSDLCVDFCTADDQCQDSCAPRCAIERGCCVECYDDDHCPVPQWRGSQLEYTECSADFMCVLPEGDEPSPDDFCNDDDDCNTAGLPACSFTQNKCVECLYDDHCGGATPACDTGAQQCVDCTADHHCRNIDDEDGDDTYCDSNQQCVDGAGLVGVSLFAALAVALAQLF